MQAQASKLSSKESDTSDSRFKGFDEFMASAKADAAPQPEPGVAAAGDQQQDVPEAPYSPSKNLTSDDEDAGLLDLTNLIGFSNLAEKQVRCIFCLRACCCHLLLMVLLLLQRNPLQRADTVALCMLLRIVHGMLLTVYICQAAWGHCKLLCVSGTPIHVHC